MHKEVLSENQIALFPLVRQFKREFYLAGGTALALYLGHRRSIDFDFFKPPSLNHYKVVSKIAKAGYPYRIDLRIEGQLNLNIRNVKFTFLEYPFIVEAKNKYEDCFRLPELIDLASMKAYALGRRSKWRDYVDMYFILKDYFSIDQISERAFQIFDQLFSEKLFRAQLCYFHDVDHSEALEYLVPEVPEDKVKKFLIDKATELDF